MNLSSYLVERVTRLGPPQTRDLTVQRDLQVKMPDRGMAKLHSDVVEFIPDS